MIKPRIKKFWIVIYKPLAQMSIIGKYVRSSRRAGTARQTVGTAFSRDNTGKTITVSTGVLSGGRTQALRAVS